MPDNTSGPEIRTNPDPNPLCFRRRVFYFEDRKFPALLSTVDRGLFKAGFTNARQDVKSGTEYFKDTKV
jgi:hypothetical protein